MRDIDVDDGTFDNFVNPLEGLRLPRRYITCDMTYAHDGDMLGNNDSTSRDLAKNWNKLMAAATDMQWRTEFWISEATFNELFVLVQPCMQDYSVNHDGLRT